MKFDVVVGNPPYQEPGEARDEPIFQYFYDLADKMSSQYCLISPGRFLFNAGQTPESWNKKMLADDHLKVLFYEQNSSKVFAGTDIKGGLAVIYKDASSTVRPIGIFSQYSELNSISHKVADTNPHSFANLVQPQGIYKFSDLFFSDFPDAEKMQGKGTRNKIVSRSFSGMPFAFKDGPAPDQSSIQMLGLVSGKREYKWIEKKYLELPPSFDKWKVLVPEANGSGAIGEVLSTPLIGQPLIGHTDTFLTIGEFNEESEARNVLAYIKTKFARTMLGLLKITQHNSRKTWTQVPLQNFTSESDIDWTVTIPEIDQQLYKKYGFDKGEIDFIESKVKPMG